MTGDRLVVIVSGKPWDGVRGADRQLAEQLVRYGRVLWVDPPASPATPEHFRPGTGRMLLPQLRPVADRIDRLSPVVLPGLTRPGIRATTWPLVRAQLRWALRRLGRPPHAVVACSFDDVLGRVGRPVHNVLYGTDDWVAGAELMGLDPAWLRREEARALARADVVVAVTPQLAQRWRGLGAEPVLVPNGCDPAAYSTVDSAALPAAVAGLPPPVVGLVGRLSARIDIGLLEEIADAGLSLLVVGPQEGEWEPERWPRLAARPNVRHVDRVPFAELPGYLRAIDVGITPYLDTAFNRSSFPLKTLEYLAAGRAAVSTDLPAARWLAADEAAAAAADPAELGAAGAAPPGPADGPPNGPPNGSSGGLSGGLCGGSSGGLSGGPSTGAAAPALVTIAEPAGFVAAIRAAAALPRSAELVARRRRFAARHSWSERADRFAAAIGLTADAAVPEATTEARSLR